MLKFGGKKVWVPSARSDLEEEVDDEGCVASSKRLFR
jgi:hypothetical protein